MKSKLLLLILIIFMVPIANCFTADNLIAQEKQTKKKPKVTKVKKDDLKKMDAMPEIISQPSPKYPESAQKDKIQGTVWLKVFVGENGEVKEVKTAKMEGGNADLEKSAMDAAKETKFKPGQVNGKPVECWVTIPYRFKLK
jgi:TonB family protein